MQHAEGIHQSGCVGSRTITYPVPEISMSERQGRLLSIVSIVLSILTLTYTVLWFAGIV
jgi:hypothetical protein